MTNIFAIARIGKNLLSTNPNDFMFHSSYNTFKIILVGTKNITLSASTTNQNFTQAHNLQFIPLVDAFAKRSGVSQVFKPNGIDVELWSSKNGFTGDIIFNYISSDATNITLNFDNAKVSTVDVSIRYFCLEKVD